MSSSEIEIDVSSSEESGGRRVSPQAHTVEAASSRAAPRRRNGSATALGQKRKGKAGTTSTTRTRRKAHSVRNVTAKKRPVVILDDSSSDDSWDSGGAKGMRDGGGNDDDDDDDDDDSDDGWIKPVQKRGATKKRSVGGTGTGTGTRKGKGKGKGKGKSRSKSARGNAAASAAADTEGSVRVADVAENSLTLSQHLKRKRRKPAAKTKKKQPEALPFDGGDGEDVDSDSDAATGTKRRPQRKTGATTSKLRRTTPFGAPTRAPPFQSLARNGSGNAVDGDGFVRPAAVGGGGGASNVLPEAFRTELWSDAAAPGALNDVSVSTIKRNAVERWLVQAQAEIRARKPDARKLLVLAGPPGAGKSTLVRCLCAKLGVELCEWVEQAVTLQRGVNGAVLQRDLPAVDTFAVWLKSVQSHGLLSATSASAGGGGGGGGSGGRVLLLDDLSVLSDERYLPRLFEAMTLFMRRTRFPLVVVVSEGNDAYNRVWQSFVDEMVRLPMATLTKVPAATAASMKRCLARLLRVTGLTCAQSERTMLVHLANGDVRLLCNMCQFMATLHRPDNAKPAKGRRIKATKKGAGELNTGLLHVMAGKTIEYATFHIIAKILHNKREGDNGSNGKDGSSGGGGGGGRSKKKDDAGSLVTTTARSRGGRLADGSVDYQGILEHTSMDGGTMSLFVHENYTKYVTEIEHCAAVAPQLSDADMLYSYMTRRNADGGGGGGVQQMNDFSSLAAAGGYMFATRDVAVQGVGFDGVRRPRHFDLVRNQRHFSDVRRRFVGTAGSGASVRLEEIPASLLPAYCAESERDPFALQFACRFNGIPNQPSLVAAKQRAPEPSQTQIVLAADDIGSFSD